MEELAYIQSQQTTYVLEKKNRTKRQKAQVDRKTNEPLVSGEGVPLESPDVPFLRLLGGEEPEQYTRLRYKLYKEMVTRQDAAAEKIMEEVSTQTLKEIQAVIEKPVSENLDTVLLLSNSSVATTTIFLQQLKAFVSKRHNHRLVMLNSKEVTTMRLALKGIVTGLTHSKTSGADLYDDEDDIKTFDKRVPWDLEVAQEWCQRFWDSEGLDINNSDLRVVLVLEDIDSFNVLLLNRLIKLIHSFRTRVPIKLIFNVGTNIKSFSNKLTNDVIQCLNFSRFKIEQTDNIINKIVTDIIVPESYLIGEDLAKFILDRFRMSVKNVDEFLRILKYAKMTFFFNNPLIVLPHILHPYKERPPLHADYFKALRTLPSFKRYITVMMDKHVALHKIENLLQDDDTLEDALIKATSLYTKYANGFKSVLKLITQILAKRSFKTTKNYLDFYYKLSSKDEFVRLQFINEMLSLLKNVDVESVREMVKEISLLSNSDPFIKPLYAKLNTNLDVSGLDDLLKGSNAPVGSAEQLNYKIETRKIKENFLAVLDEFLRSNISSSDRIVFNEIFKINDSDVVKQNLVPPTRAIIQESLINHEKYIGFSKTGHEAFDSLDNNMNPVIADLFALYRETNLHMNIYDYYATFRETLNKDQIMKDINAILDDPRGVLEHYLSDELRFKYIYQFFNNTEMSEEEKWQRLTLTFFLQKCEEMISCGFFKQIKKKGETLEKAIWKDL